ncbi:MAG: Glucosamine-6-phosphate isomerase [Limisphaerales bacterium]|nr:MAG: Glucosamine-6-phosphate isomerase [Limisphaerales bacterium]TXT46442.1 MAG: Glucosamine-6-phosphate isomerase [Limisphaerales bacterium]
MASLAEDFARTLLAEIRAAQAAGRGGTFIVPVGPVDQFPIFARMVNEARLSLRDVVFINMDEYLTDDDAWVPESHPLSFRGYMERAFYGLLDPKLRPPPEHRVFPDPRDCGAVQRLIDARGGVDVTFGGIGINGHLAFNEPPEGNAESSQRLLTSSPTVEEFAALPTRVLSLSRETRTINSVTVGGGIEVVPTRCVTVGMKEILASRKLRFYCNRPWQSAVVRRVLHGPIAPACPASLLRLHSDAVLTVADYVAQPPDIRLR